MTLSSPDLLATMRSEIPLCTALGVAVLVLDDGVTLRMPVVGNRNGMGTVFAGSLHALCTLSGWGLLTRWVYDADVGPCEVVLQDSSIHFSQPVRSTPHARCEPLDPSDDEHLRRALRKHRPGRVRLAVGISIGENPDQIAARFVGRYIVRPKPSSPR